ncbi:MAG TPA: DNA repair protein RecO [Candidatus Saccharimonadales bacterium]|nr:DNA repair protein RecO [Candidatus Saccharimonadales bacterium]
MNQIVSTGIILNRINYQEADRIITFLSPDYGKLRTIAKGVRKAKAKLAGSVELFSTANITILPSRGDLGILISARLIKYYSKIVKDLDRTELAYKVMKLVNKITEDSSGEEYFEIVNTTFASLDNLAIPLDLVRLWVGLHLISTMGHAIDLSTGRAGKLSESSAYNFDFEKMHFYPEPRGVYSKDQIKLLRLISEHRPEQIVRVDGYEQLLSGIDKLVSSVLLGHGLSV